MRPIRHASLAAALVALIASGAAAQQLAQAPTPHAASAAAAPAHGRQLTIADLDGWKTIRDATPSSDGKWLAYILAPNEGDATVVIRGTADGAKEMRFPIGELPAPSFGAFGPAAAPRGLAISGDSKWAVFTVHPTRAEARRAKKEHKPTYDRVELVNLATGETRTFDHVRRWALSDDEAPRVLALGGYPPEAAPSSGGPGAGAGAAGARPAPRSEAADLILVDLAGGPVLTIGDVGDWAFDDAGRYVAYTIESRQPAADGVQLRDLRTGVTRVLDAGAPLYRRLAWADSGLALAVLRGAPDSATRDTLYSLLAFTRFGAEGPRETVLDPAKRGDFPAGMKISPDRSPSFSGDFGTVFFGIRQARKPVKGDSVQVTGPLPPAGAPGMGGTINQNPRALPDDDQPPTLILWHWKDSRLQSQQMVEEARDKAYSWLTEYRLGPDRVIRLADDSVRDVTVLPHERWAMGIDTRPYDHYGAYTGRYYRDVYAIDLATGARRMLVQKDQSFPIPSPDGGQLLSWGKDGQWHVIDIATGADRDITARVPTNFANVEDDHNNIYPPEINPQRSGLGWSRDGRAVLLSDGWDIWQVPVNGGNAVNLTGNGKAERIRFQDRLVVDRKEKGIDLSQPVYVSMYGEWTKKEGLARLTPGKSGARRLVWDDAKYDFTRARKADVFLYTRQTFSEFPDWWVASADFSGGRRITDANPQQKDVAWSSGQRLIDYVSAKGDTLQGALFLPANYEPGKKYPMLVMIYEKLSQSLHQYAVPSATRTPDPSIYTSRGYAVLMPDIVYRVNDPGMSAVWCVIPAVNAAIATGVVDSSRIGLWGHSWGGYQTAFLVTQTNLFHAAVAGAPLTNMVSMYASVYWNSGGSDAAIFESSQGRFKGNFLENEDAYLRNSPVFHADKVTTPLMILHDDKDGAVDFNQGITYFNTLRQLGKQVILLEYVGENHGLRDPVNQKDYAIRMRQFFDHWLLGAPAPGWLANGVPRIELEEELRHPHRVDATGTEITAESAEKPDSTKKP